MYAGIGNRLFINGKWSPDDSWHVFNIIHRKRHFNRFSQSKIIKTLGHDGLLGMKDNQVTGPEKTLQKRKYNTKNRVQFEGKGRLTLHLKGGDCC